MIVLWSATWFACQGGDPIEPPPPPQPITPAPPAPTLDPPTDGGTTFDTGPGSTEAWPSDWVAIEEEMLILVNVHRSLGTPCPETPSVASVALVHDPLLREAARLHSEDMSVRDYFGHDTPDGVTVRMRIEAAGYTGSPYGENIANGYGPNPEAVMTALMGSQIHCENIMDPTYRDIGIGHHFLDASDGPRRHWTQNFGTGG